MRRLNREDHAFPSMSSMYLNFEAEEREWWGLNSKREEERRVHVGAEQEMGGEVNEVLKRVGKRVDLGRGVRLGWGWMFDELRRCPPVKTSMISPKSSFVNQTNLSLCARLHGLAWPSNPKPSPSRQIPVFLPRHKTRSSVLSSHSSLSSRSSTQLIGIAGVMSACNAEGL